MMGKWINEVAKWKLLLTQRIHNLTVVKKYKIAPEEQIY